MPRRPAPAPKAKPGETRTSIGGEATPQLPHERDESAASSAQQPLDPTVEQAYADVSKGLVDTDRGPVLERVYQRQRGKKP